MDKILAILAAIFLVETFFYNVIKTDLPKIPGDIYINKPNFRVYIPFVSALALSVFFTLFGYLFLPS